MKRQMARPGAGRDFREGRIVGGQRGLCRVKFINQNFVKAEIGRQGDPVGAALKE